MIDSLWTFVELVVLFVLVAIPIWALRKHDRMFSEGLGSHWLGLGTRTSAPVRDHVGLFLGPRRERRLGRRWTGSRPGEQLRQLGEHVQGQRRAPTA